MDRHYLKDAADVIAGLGTLAHRFSGKRVLITGAAGFLGSQFVHFFLALNDSNRLAAPCHVAALDNFLRGTPEWLSELQERTDLEIVQADIVRCHGYPPADFAIHAASIASPLFYRQHPIETMDANVTGLRRLLDQARGTGMESLLFFSSSEIYGDPDPAHIPTPETYRGCVSCTGPRACYDESKRFGETLCVNFWKVHGVPVKIARPFNNYGPGLRLNDRRVLPDFFRDVLQNREVTLLSDGRATRTFCYSSDAIEGYLRLLLSEANGEPFNIGAEQPEISMLDLAGLVIRTCGRNLQVIRRTSPDAHYTTDNPQRRCPDLAKARRQLQYAPRVRLEAGLERLRDYYLDHPEG